MTTPKSPEQIMEEFVDRTYVLDIDHSCCFKKEEEEAWLRSSMASLLCYMAERMQHVPKNEEFFIGHECCMEHDANNPAPIYCGQRNTALDDCRTLLIEEARKISEV